MKKISLKDIAMRVGVSTAAVSLVLNGKEKEGRVGKELAEKIRQAAREMNYEPNRLARSLQSGRSMTAGLLVADISNPFFAALAFHIQEEMERAGYAVIMMNTNEDAERMSRMIGVLRSRQVDGLIVVPAEGGDDSLAQLVREHVPLVLIDRACRGVVADTVTIDNYGAAYEAAAYLLKAGCKRIALVVYCNRQPHMSERKRGYTDALTEAGLWEPGLVREVDYNSLEDDMEDAAAFLLRKENGIDGVLFATNTIALSGLRRIYRLKKRVPAGLRVVSFDKNEAFDFLPLPVPYIRQPVPDMGRSAARLLLEQIEGAETRGPSVREWPALLVDPSGCRVSGK